MAWEEEVDALGDGVSEGDASLLSGEADRLGDRQADGLPDEEVVGEPDGDPL